MVLCSAQRLWRYTIAVYDPTWYVDTIFGNSSPSQGDDYVLQFQRITNNGKPPVSVGETETV